MKPLLISKEEVGEILRRAQELALWVKSLEEFALSEGLQGEDVPGWKLVEGRAVMQLINQEKAFKLLIDNGFEESMLYERKPLTLSETEKLVGRTKFMELISSYTHTLHCKHTLALSEDKREFLKEGQMLRLLQMTADDLHQEYNYKRI